MRLPASVGPVLFAGREKLPAQKGLKLSYGET